MAKYNEFTYEDYVESEAVRRAEKALNDHLASAPGAYESRWDGEITSALNSILNRERFNYDFNADPLYQQHRDRYLKQGRLAMANTVGQASALTGGYSNSWATTAGSQAYQGYLEGLNDLLPDLYSLAAERYRMEGADLLDRYSVLADREAEDYGRYRDKVSDYQSDRDYLAGRYDSERDYDYGVYSDGRDFSYNAFNDQRNYEFQQARAAAEDAQWAAEMAFREEQAQAAAEQWQKEFEYKMSLNANTDLTPNPPAPTDTPAPSTDSPSSSGGQGDPQGLALSDELMSAFTTYIDAGDIDSATDMLAAFKAGGVRPEDIDRCMKMINDYYLGLNLSSGNGISGVPHGATGVRPSYSYDIKL